MNSKRLVLDANILIRAVLGNKVRNNLIQFVSKVEFFAPELCFVDAHKYVPQLLAKRNIEVEPALDILNYIESFLVIPLAENSYSHYEAIAKARLMHRDINDWSILAAALALDCPIWTEDMDFFGAGVATWTSDKVIFYLDETLV